MGKPIKRVAPRIANQVNRNLDNLMIQSIVRTVKSMDSPWEPNEMGCPGWNPKIVAVCCFIKVFFNRSYDGTEAYLRSNDTVCKCLKTDKLPGHSVIGRGMHKLPTSYIRKASRRLTMHLRRRGMNIALDSSGFSLNSSSSWFDIRIQRKSRKKDHMKLHIVIDAETLAILHFTITGWRGADTKEFKRLIRDLPRLGKVAADKGYTSRKNCQAVASKGGTPYICFKSNCTGRAKGYPAWKYSFNAYTTNPDKWMSEYHFRSIVEAVFSSIKKCWGSDIKSKKGWLKRKELAIKTVAYNIKRTLYVERAEELAIPLWVSYVSPTK